jgi:hypothetical protein
MTRDANKQSVKRCNEYSHRWIKTATFDEYTERHSRQRIACSICGANPTAKQFDQSEAILNLRDFVKPGMVIYTTLRNVSRSGMQRVIDVHVMQNNEPRWIGYMAAKAIGDRYDDKRQGIVVGGCGMDMGFSIAYNLSRYLFPDGFGCIGKGDGYATQCPSNDHSNGDRDYTAHVEHATGPDHICATNPESCTAPKHWHSDGGYALRHKWL